MKRSPLRRTRMKRKPRRGGPMPLEVRETVIRRSGGVCEAKLPGICTGAGEEVHHRRPRDRYNDEVVNLLHLCRACHRHITDRSPRVGFDRGLRISRHGTDSPGLHPVLYRGDYWATLGPTGQIIRVTIS